MSKNSKITSFLKDWMLIIGMITGAGLYLAYHAIPSIHGAGPVLESICKAIQPVLLFTMLFLSFCKISPKDLKPHKWQGWLLLIQSGSFILMALAILWALSSSSSIAGLIVAKRLTIESAMLCMICPTATACAVVTDKLGGDMAQCVTYTILINLVVAFIVPLIVPLIYPMGGMTFAAAFVKILKRYSHCLSCLAC
jgi:Sodium Bile acid symporter family.